MDTILYRIIDANYNRAREALRVMEEYCRFGLDSSALSGRAKCLRHTLCDTLSKLDAMALLCSRDVAGDVGRELKVEAQLCRQSLEDCFTAAAKRATEALRALAEFTQTLDAKIATVMEQLRFEVYALEKDAALTSHAKLKFGSVRLYVLINADTKTPESSVLNLVRTCIANGADCLQLRVKDLADAPWLKLAEAFTAVCKETGVVSIINDRADIAILAGADGVHLGQDEIPAAKARQLARSPLIVGVSTHNPDELARAMADGCDYAALGPAYISSTKPHLQAAGPDYIRYALGLLEQAGTFHVAIGGINANNLPELQQIGVKAIAVGDAIIGANDPALSCKTLKSMLLNPPQ
ncbi:MAG: thiamine phosphate synthase [Planctomycetales bacterium]|nr:thiamine phosphate synthase [Planctomycetales bacterium]